MRYIGLILCGAVASWGTESSLSFQEQTAKVKAAFKVFQFAPESCKTELLRDAVELMQRDAQKRQLEERARELRERAEKVRILYQEARQLREGLERQVKDAQKQIRKVKDMKARVTRRQSAVNDRLTFLTLRGNRYAHEIRQMELEMTRAEQKKKQLLVAIFFKQCEETEAQKLIDIEKEKIASYGKEIVRCRRENWDLDSEKLNLEREKIELIKKEEIVSDIINSVKWWEEKQLNIVEGKEKEAAKEMEDTNKEKADLDRDLDSVCKRYRTLRQRVAEMQS